MQMAGIAMLNMWDVQLQPVLLHASIGPTRQLQELWELPGVEPCFLQLHAQVPSASHVVSQCLGPLPWGCPEQ